MQNIPIIVSRLNSQGAKQFYTIQESISPTLVDNLDEPSSRNTRKKFEFNTIDQCESQGRKVRVKRIQSSGGRRRLPKDFFSRESNRSSHKASDQKPLQQARTAEDREYREQYIQTDLSERENTENPKNQDYNIETPKFKQKIFQETPSKNDEMVCNSHQATRNHSSNKIKIRSTTKKGVFSNSVKKQCKSDPNSLRSTKQNNEEGFIKNHPQPICFQNTFSANQFNKIPQWTCKPFEINLLKGKTNYKNEQKERKVFGEKQNQPMKKRSKANLYQQSQIKKFSLIKDRTGFFNLRSLVKFEQK